MSGTCSSRTEPLGHPIKEKIHSQLLLLRQREQSITYDLYLAKSIQSFEYEINIILFQLLVRDFEFRSEPPVRLSNPLSFHR